MDRALVIILAIFLLGAACQLKLSSFEGIDRGGVDFSCPANSTELGEFLAQHPERGMPFGFPPLAPNEHTVLATMVEEQWSFG